MVFSKAVTTVTVARKAGFLKTVWQAQALGHNVLELHLLCKDGLYIIARICQRLRDDKVWDRHLLLL